MRYIEGVDRKRKISFPEYIDDYITDDNPVRVINSFIDSLGIIELGFKNTSPSYTGRPGYDPRVLLKLKDINEISTTDPDARLMAVNNNGVDVCYNVQTVVDSKHKLIVDCDVINNPTDHGQLSEMSIRAKNVFEADNLKALADKGYYNADDLRACEKAGITTYVSKQAFANSTGEIEFYLDKFKYDKERNIYICPAGQELNCIRRKPIDENTKALKYKNFKACSKCKYKDKCTKNKDGRVITRSIDQDFLDTVDQRTNENKNLYKTRQMIVEHPFGTVKRSWGLSYFLTRGLESVKTEASLAFLAYNMKRVINIMGIKKMIERLKALNPLFNLSVHKSPI
ncbi:MAG: transposase [Clostridia bacterium]